MLGKLALWLRLAGIDAVYETDFPDSKIIEIAEKDSRILLTSDAELQERAEKRGIESMLVRGPVDVRIAEVFHQYRILPEIDPDEARCSKCNGELIRVSREEKSRIQDFVHDQTYNHYDVFWHCQKCDSVYFQGGYWDNIQKYMKQISELIESMN